MLCYKDRTFCTFYKNCRDRNECTRPLTKEVEDAARDWWGDGPAPIATFAEVPHCHREKPEHE